MSVTLQKSRTLPEWSVVDELRNEGVSYDDIRAALDLQEIQRRHGVPVMPLRTMCGLEPTQRRRDPKAVGASRPLGTAVTLHTTPITSPRRGGLHITRRPVRGGSIQTGADAEAEFVRPLAEQERSRLWSTANRVFKLSKKLAAEARAGARLLSDAEQKLIGFTTSCRDVLLKLLDDEKYRKGWCVPAYETIMGWTGLSYSTVHRALTKLAELGLIEWVNRYNYSYDNERGARSEQTSNLYRFDLPAWVAKMVGLFVPPPADEEDRRERALEDHARMMATASKPERRRMMPTDAEGRRRLIVAGIRADRRAQLEARECQNHIPPHRSHHKEELEGAGLSRPARRA